MWDRCNLLKTLMSYDCDSIDTWSYLGSSVIKLGYGIGEGYGHSYGLGYGFGYGTSYGDGSQYGFGRGNGSTYWSNTPYYRLTMFRQLAKRKI